MNSTIIAIASILATFNISSALDEDGREIPVEDKTTSGLIM